METKEKNDKAQTSLKLIAEATDFESVENSKLKMLPPEEYEERVNIIVSARRLVGGIQIEKIE